MLLYMITAKQSLVGIRDGLLIEVSSSLRQYLTASLSSWSRVCARLLVQQKHDIPRHAVWMCMAADNQPLVDILKIVDGAQLVPDPAYGTI